MTTRIPIRSARQDNKVLGFIEGNKAFDLSGRLCAGYDPKTSLLCDPLHGGAVGYVTLDGKYLGSSKVAENLFPQTYEVATEESALSYVNDVASLPKADEQQPTRGAEAGIDASELTAAPRIVAIESTQVSVTERPSSSVKNIFGTTDAKEHLTGRVRVITVETTIAESFNIDASDRRKTLLEASSAVNSSVAEECAPRPNGTNVCSAGRDVEPTGTFNTELPTSRSNVVYLQNLAISWPKPPEVSVAAELCSQPDSEKVLPIGDDNEEPVSSQSPPDQMKEALLGESFEGANRSSNSTLKITGSYNESVPSDNDHCAQTEPLIQDGPPTSRSSADEPANYMSQSNDNRILEMVAVFMQRVADYVGSAPKEDHEKVGDSPWVAGSFDREYDLTDASSQEDGRERGSAERDHENDVEAERVHNGDDIVARQNGKYDANIIKNRKVEGQSTSDNGGSDVAQVEECSEAHWSKEDQVAVELATNGAQFNLSEQSGEETSNDSRDSAAVADLRDAELDVTFKEDERADNEPHTETDFAQDSEAASVEVKLGRLSAESHDFPARNEEKYLTDEQMLGGSGAIVDDRRPRCRQPVADDLEPAFKFLQDMRDRSWLGPTAGELSSPEENVLEELERTLKQLEQ